MRETGAARAPLVAGHVLTFDPADYRDRTAVRTWFGYGDEPLALVSAEGGAVGGNLLRLCIDALPYVRERIPELRMLMVCGPRLSTSESALRGGVEIRG